MTSSHSIPRDNVLSVPVLVVHGALGSATQLMPVVDALRTAGFNAVAIELAGHGNTPASDEAFTMASFADQLCTAGHDLGTQRPICFGYSMGGYAALLAEQHHPGTFSAIVTLGTMLQWTPVVAAQAAGRLDVTTVRSKVPAFAELLAMRHAGAGGWEPLMTRTAQLLCGLGNTPLLTPTTAERISCPVTFLVGGRDDSVSLADTATFAAALPQAQVELLDNVPHPIEKVPLDRVVAMVRQVAIATSHISTSRAGDAPTARPR